MIDEHTHESLLQVVERSSPPDASSKDSRRCSPRPVAHQGCCGWTTARSWFLKRCNSSATARSACPTFRRITVAQRLRRIVQLPHPRRMPEHQQLLVTGPGQRGHHRLETRLPPPPPTLIAGLPTASPLRCHLYPPMNDSRSWTSSRGPVNGAAASHRAHHRDQGHPGGEHQRLTGCRDHPQPTGVDHRANPVDGDRIRDGPRQALPAEPLLLLIIGSTILSADLLREENGVGCRIPLASLRSRSSRSSSWIRCPAVMHPQPRADHLGSPHTPTDTHTGVLGRFSLHLLNGGSASNPTRFNQSRSVRVVHYAFPAPTTNASLVPQPAEIGVPVRRGAADRKSFARAC